jgi:hypothetical protein
MPVVLLCGCGTAAYHERMEAQLKTLKELQAARPKIDLSMLYPALPEANLPGEHRVTLRIPRCFTKNSPVYNEQTLNPRSGKTYLAPQIWPLGVEIPGYYWTYEATIPEGATEPEKITGAYTPRGDEIRWSYYFAFGALQVSPEEASEAIQAYLQEVNVALAETTEANPAQIDGKPELLQIVEIEDQQKEKVHWKFLHLEADMFFASYQGSEEKSWEKKPGVVEIYFVYHKQHLVVLTGKWIKGMEASTLMPDYLPMVASTVKIDDAGLAPPPAAAE